MKRPLFMILAIAIALLAYILWLAPVSAPENKTTTSSSLPQKIITVDGHRFIVEVATTAQDMVQGLGDRASLPVGHGMLFVYPQAGIYGFWMRHMRFPIDIIWFKDGKIVDIAPDMPAPKGISDLPAIHQPTVKADTVLEINAGQAKVLGLKIGDKME
jgi:uncharacterized protein